MYKVCAIMVEQVTDVLIFKLSELFNQKLESQEDKDLFKSLWFSYLKTIFSYADKTEELNKCIKENLTRALESHIDTMDP